MPRNRLVTTQKGGGIGVLASATVNLNEGTAAKQPLYTVPAGRKAVVLFVVPRDFSAANPAAAIFDVGFNAGGDDLITGIDVTSVAATGDNFVTSNTGAGKTGAAASVLGAKVTTPEGSALTAVVDVIGYLVAA